MDLTAFAESEEKTVKKERPKKPEGQQLRPENQVKYLFNVISYCSIPFSRTQFLGL